MNRIAASRLALERTRPPREQRGAKSEFQRYELKFRLPVELISDLRRAVSPYMEPDPHAKDRPDHTYTVRSIYYDSEDLIFYHEKLDSVKIRKKLRIRGYNRPEDGAPVFFEIKRKYGRRGFKERLSMPIGQLLPALNGVDEATADLPFLSRKVVERFRFNIVRKHLRPVVLVSYEREPMIGIDDQRLRVTFDQNIRSLIDPNLDQLFEERSLRQFEDRHFVLELKFDELMPRWMAQLMRDFDLRSHSYSKYCHGIDAWTPHPQ